MYGSKKLCRELGGELPIVRNSDDIKAMNYIATRENGNWYGDNNFWIDLTHDDSARVICQDLNCDNAGLYWERDSLPFNTASEFKHVYWTSQAADREVCAYFETSHWTHTDDAIIRNTHCWDQYRTICEFDCEVPTCPVTHPFAVENGAHCCKWYNKINDGNINVACNGNDFGAADPVACCPNGESIVCWAGQCANNPAGEQQCPTDPNFSRVPGTDKGIRVRENVNEAWSSGVAWCTGQASWPVAVESYNDQLKMYELCKHHLHKLSLNTIKILF